MTTVFKDQKSNTPLFTCEIGAGYETQAVFETFRNQDATITAHFRGIAANQTPSFFFEKGRSYLWQNTPDMVAGMEKEGGICLPFCSLSEQMDTLVSEFASGSAASSGYYNLGPALQEKIQKEGSEQLQKSYQNLVQASSFSQVPVEVNVTSWIMDGGIGVYPCVMKGSKKTIYCALWRLGMHVSFRVAGMMGFGQPGIDSDSWNIPMVMYMVSEQDPNEEDLKRMTQFADSLEATPEFRQILSNLDQVNQENTMREAARRAQVTQAEINQMWAMHNAAWNRVEAQRNALSADMDRFRAGLNQQMADNDAWRAQMFSPTPSSINPSESVDDRIQRMRHESIMGVNIYDREDGTSVEHTIMHDRVFENKLDQTMHVGTENWFGDNIPDGWTELLRRK